MSIDYSRDGAVAIIRFDRPDTLNAFNDEMGLAALDALRDASADGSVRAIVITGNGRAFSSGEDLGALRAGYEAGEAPSLGDTLTRRYNPMIRAIRSAPKPVIAAVNGVAAGAGASIVLASDFRIASEHAKLILAFIKVGLVPDAGSLWFLARMVGTARAWSLAATGFPLPADEGLSLGVFDRVVPGERFEEKWQAFAQETAAGPTRAFALTKELLAGAADRSIDEQLEAEVSAQTEAGASADHLEGVRAFFEKRPPHFEG